MGAKKNNRSRTAAQPRSWFGNFTYESKHQHGTKEHFVGVKAQKGFDLVLPLGSGDNGEEGFSVLDVPAGMSFLRCSYDPESRELYFCLAEDMPLFFTSRCPCCNDLPRLNREKTAVQRAVDDSRPAASV